ncbi:MAG: bifunctional chorismate mutase/prephenate dehydrogenase [uncultured bacterium]|nr:MAG: bifunctional chorismate mutase/prephenate dehydrogenase [uncultured bacterium]KKT02852.1 MAG: bifunctional chorismate mutase/prephenate dehydrogenase, chorismate mutase / prephenate dehydrogenase [Candidatus Peregrinibacteria bacterium GW2011_GWF2_43_17]KKT19993.1 MAG: T-protein [Candidatus Peregrinibacteria bacterium GW2011_GWA2_43_8]HAU39639.1 chorismate mutase [Candidatus Peregrinibacteria bacterium]
MIGKFRSKIDKIDERILKLLAERFENVIKIGEIKRGKGLKIQNKKREDEIIRKVRKLSSRFALNERFVSDFYELIIDESRKLQG